MKFLLLFLMMISTYFTKGQQTTYTCESYKYGRFKLIDSKNGINQRIERTYNRQIETDVTTGKYITFAVTWTSACEYELTFVEGNSETCNFFKTRTIIIKILETFSDGYRFEGHIKGTKDYKTHFMRVL